MQRIVGWIVLGLVWASSVDASAPPQFVERWCAWESHAGLLQCPGGVSVAANGTLVVADACLHQISCFTAEGAFITSWGGWGSAVGAFNTPTQAVTGPAGWIYVTDTGNHRIQVFSSDGEFLGVWGSQGTGPGQFVEPTGLAVTDSLVYVSDRGNLRIQVFSLSGEYLTQWDTPEPVDALETGPDGHLFAVCTRADRIDHYAPDGTWIEAWDSPNLGADAGGPTGLTWIDGEAWVSRSGSPRVAIYSAQGGWRGAWGDDPDSPADVGPARDLIARVDGRLYIADMNGCVYLFRSAPTPVQSMSWGRLKTLAP